MLAIGRGIMAKPKLMMLDEPSLGLAPVIVTQVFDIIRRSTRKAWPSCSLSRTPESSGVLPSLHHAGG
ncbi:MAG: hypothetical protein ACLUS6_07255 [Dysosmobacter sp.]